MSSDYKMPKSDVVIIALALFAAVLITIGTIYVSKNPQTLPPSKVDTSNVAMNIKLINGDSVDWDSNNELDQAIVKDGSIVWVSAGSGSCPPIIENARINVAENSVALQLKSYENQACTMDLRPVKQIISNVDGSPVDEKVRIIFMS